MRKRNASEERARLQALQSRLTHMAEELRRELAGSTTAALGELSSYDNHPAEAAATTFRRELDVTLLRSLERRRDEVERALQKVREGTYGTCDRCGQTIEPGRLEARPESIWCRRCADVEEAWTAEHPDQDEVPLPFGGMHGHEPVEVTGEDAWQEVAQWGTSDSPQDTPPAVDYDETFVGFAEPIGSVEDVEEVVDETGEVLLDAVRERPLRAGRSTKKAEGADGGGGSTPTRPA
jgi:DnaK suppressor protein